MENRIYGYARISSKDQNEDRQIDSLRAFGVANENIIVDKCSGKDTERNGYQYLKKQILRSGDTLVIKELDRLSRNKSDIKHELEYFKEHNIHVRILDIPTTLTDFPKEQMWVMDMINSILIEVLGSIAENERLKIKRRQKEGIEAARKRKVRFSRPEIPKPKNWDFVISEVKSGQLRPVDAIDLFENLKSGVIYYTKHKSKKNE